MPNSYMGVAPPPEALQPGSRRPDLPTRMLGGIAGLPMPPLHALKGPPAPPQMPPPAAGPGAAVPPIDPLQLAAFQQAGIMGAPQSPYAVPPAAGPGMAMAPGDLRPELPIGNPQVQGRPSYYGLLDPNYFQSSIKPDFQQGYPGGLLGY